MRSSASPTPAIPFLAWANLPGCSPEKASAARAALGRIDEKLDERGTAPLPPLLADLDAAWSSPCLAHVARFFPRPPVATAAELYALWHAGLRGVKAWVGGFYEREGKRYFYAPPAPPAPPTDEARRILARWTCAEGVERCGNAGTMIARAERAFDAQEETSHAWNDRSGWISCNGVTSLREEEEDPDPKLGPKATPFEAWALCIAGQLPRTHRYPPSLRLRVPDHGWLILRGRRGHYSFSDEVRAYDLATGAAYVARSESALVLGGVSVDFAATDAQRKPEAFAGNVSAETTRELAFALLSGSAMSEVRSSMEVVPMPNEITLALSERAPGFAFAPQRRDWGTSAQTRIGYVLLDDGKLIADGGFTWPGSSNPAEDHADKLVVLLEAGLERGCARARLPTHLGRSAVSGASGLDSDPARAVGTSKDLDRAIETLRDRRGRACPP